MHDKAPFESTPGVQEPVFQPAHLPGGKQLLMEQEEYCKTVFANTSMELRFYRLKESEIVPREIHIRSFQTLHIVVGALRVVLTRNGRTVEHVVREGDFFQIPPNVHHELRNVSADVTRYTSLYTPPAHTPQENLAEAI